MLAGATRRVLVSVMKPDRYDRWWLATGCPPYEDLDHVRGRPHVQPNFPIVVDTQPLSAYMSNLWSHGIR